jgi:hypothetical protein
MCSFIQKSLYGIHNISFIPSWIASKAQNNLYRTKVTHAVLIKHRPSLHQFLSDLLGNLVRFGGLRLSAIGRYAFRFERFDFRLIIGSWWRFSCSNFDWFCNGLLLFLLIVNYKLFFFVIGVLVLPLRVVERVNLIAFGTVILSILFSGLSQRRALAYVTRQIG